VLHLIALSKIQEAPTADHLTVVNIEKDGGVKSDDLGGELLCFAADGVTVFQGALTGVTKQLYTKHAPFSIGVHCFSHRVNLAARTLSANIIFQNSEKLMQKAHVFFNRLSKRLSKF
jgi:hypothetical protein